MPADDLLNSNEIASIDEVVALNEIANAYTSCWRMLHGSPAAYTKIHCSSHAASLSLVNV
jgi:hypothetical protein